MNKAIFLDRDGVINVDKKPILIEHLGKTVIGYAHKPEHFEFIPRAIEALKKLSNTNYLLIIITSQSGIGRGYFSEDQFQEFNKYMLNIFEKEGIKIHDIFFCPHHPEKGVGKYKIDCNCRKPKPGMILNAAKKHNINLKESFVIGDSRRDIEMGENAGCKTIFVNTNKLNGEEFKKINANFNSKDLFEATELILKND